MKKINFLFTALICALLMASCGKDDEDEKTDLEVPSSYDGANFNANASAQLDLVDRLNDLTADAKRGRDANNLVTKADLDQLFTTGNPSLSGEITSYFKGKLEGNGGWFDELAKASGKTWTLEAPGESSEGGVYAGYLFDENGLEIEQLVEKGQFNATLYNHAVKLMSGDVTLATVDQILAVFGAKPAFANSGSSNASADVRDRAMANYGARRDKNDGNGLYTQIKTAFITLQAAIKAGDEYTEEQEAALKDIQVLWEKINAATAINYCHAPIAKLSETNPGEAEIGSALHAIAEGIGFIHGFKTINQQYRQITDAQIDEVLTLFNAPSDATPTVYKFATDPANELSKLTSIINKLQDIYGFSDQEIEDFKSNWVSSQNR